MFVCIYVCIYVCMYVQCMYVRVVLATSMLVTLSKQSPGECCGKRQQLPLRMCVVGQSTEAVDLPQSTLFRIKYNMHEEISREQPTNSTSQQENPATVTPGMGTMLTGCYYFCNQNIPFL